jgi:sarcosine oxidase subunit gamma
VSVSEPASPPIAILRVWPCDPAAVDRLSAAFRLAWPTAPNTTASDGVVTVRWLAPGEWAVTGKAPQEVMRAAAGGLGDTLHHLVDMTDGLVTFRVDGAVSRDLIAKGCGLDLHPRTFTPGACAQTLLAQCSAWIFRPGEGDAFEITIDATLRDHLQAWFADAVLEFAP